MPTNPYIYPNAQGVIDLTGQGQPRRRENPIAKGLNYISAAVLEPTTLIRDPRAAAQKVRDRRAAVRRGEKGAAASVIGESIGFAATGTALTLGAAPASTLAGAGRAAAALRSGQAAVRGLAAKTVSKGGQFSLPRTALTVTGVSALASSPTLRSIGASTIEDPTKTGRAIGSGIEKINEKAKGSSAFQKALAIGGLAAAAGLLGAGAVAATKAVKNRFSRAPVAATPGAQPVALSPTLGEITPLTSQSAVTGGEVPVIDEPAPVEASAGALTPSPVNVRVHNRVNINNQSAIATYKKGARLKKA